MQTNVDLLLLLLMMLLMMMMLVNGVLPFLRFPRLPVAQVTALVLWDAQSEAGRVTVGGSRLNTSETDLSSD